MKPLNSHACPDWDYDAIYPGTPEWECCTCTKTLKPKEEPLVPEPTKEELLAKIDQQRVKDFLKQHGIEPQADWDYLFINRMPLTFMVQLKTKFHYNREIQLRNSAKPEQEKVVPKFVADPGAHYRYSYKGVNLDPFRIAQIYSITNFAQLTVLKKILCTGNRGYKELDQDIDDCICALQRWKEMRAEDTAQMEKVNSQVPAASGSSFESNELG